MYRILTATILFTLTVNLATAVSAQATKTEQSGKTPATFPEPLMATPSKAVLQEDFSKLKELKKTTWQSRQGTRWAVEDGVLRGMESSPEYQAKKKDHFGYEPRLSIPVTPPEFVATFSFRFIDGKETGIVPFVEFGHHICRVRFTKESTMLLSDGETMKLAEDKNFVWQSGKWYHATAEMKGKEFVMQIVDGPTFYAQRDSFAAAPQAGGNGLGIAGPRKGQVELDNITISTIETDEKKGWTKAKEAFPAFEPVQIKEPKKKKPKQKKPTKAKNK